jgi:hypothetical protein
MENEIRKHTRYITNLNYETNSNISHMLSFPLFLKLAGFLSITNFYIIHRPVFYLKYSVQETVFCPRLQVETIQLRPTERETANPFLWTESSIRSVILNIIQGNG